MTGEGALKPSEAIAEQHADLTQVQRGRLFRRYFLLILALVCGALLISGGIGLYFSYQENKGALASLQHEKALSAAARIEQFVLQIEQQLAYAALPQLGVEGLEQRRIEFLKLLRVVHAVTDITQIDAKGREQLSVSRLKMDEAGTERDWSNEPAFKNARPGQTWYGPVYFRKETEPYMSIAVRSGGEAGAVTVAEVNLKFIWDVVTRIRVGQKGKAYVVDSSGHLVADPDIGLVLRKTDMSGLEQVRTALKPDADETLAMLAKDLTGTTVLTAYAPIEPAREQPLQGARPTPLGWKVFIEQPVAEVYQALDATVIRTVALLVAGLLFSALAAMWLARNMARPISVLQEGAQRIGAGDLDAQISIKTGDELESLADQFNRMTAQLRESYAGLERKVEERTGELKQALDFQSASGEILSSITSSIADTQPVFQVIVQNLLRLFGTRFALVVLLRDGRLYAAAYQGHPGFEKVAQAFPSAVGESFAGKAIAAQRVLQLAPIIGNPEAAERSQTLARSLGYNSIIAAPMMREDKVIGAIMTGHQEATPFNDKQIALLKAFADQAVIAIENARLVNETKEALEQQTATSEILKVISSATTDTQPVFEAIVQSTRRLFQTSYAALTLVRDEKLVLMATAGDERFVDYVRKAYPQPLNDDGMLANRAVRTGQVLQLCPIIGNPAAPSKSEQIARQTGYNSILITPMMREGVAIGHIATARSEAIPFDQKQVALVKAFADQAVIAIENARLVNETKESLEQQTAIGEILRVMSSSPSDVQPVLQAVAERAARICDASDARIWLAEADEVRHAAGFGDMQMPVELGATMPLGPGTVVGRAILERATLHVDDVIATEDFSDGRQLHLKSGVRTFLAVPLMRENRALGAIMLRRKEVKPFNEKQVALLKTFADQAAIAIENVRLFNETKESLERQTATADVLSVISASPTNVQPVFEAILEKAVRLCDAHLGGLFLRDSDVWNIVSYRGENPEVQAVFKGIRPGPQTGLGRLLQTRQPVHIHDLLQDGATPSRDPVRIATIEKMGARTFLAVPLVKEGTVIGAVVIYRREVRPFADAQIRLVATFADQAVIAIENVRLFNETKESLERQTAISEVLRAISNTPTDVRPVLDAVAQRATRLCEAAATSIYVLEAGVMRRAAFNGPASLQGADTVSYEPGTITGRVIAEGKALHVENVEQERDVYPVSWERAQRFGQHQSMLAVPLLREGRPFGTMFLRRTEVRPFNEKQIELATTFANQAAIAVENVRLFREIQEKSAQLEVANKHKSEFLANMSHELRTPLNAIIGFSEVLMEKMFGEVNEKQADYLKDIHESGRHLLSLINDILDLSKIEAGRMDLEISSFHLPTALSNAMTLVRERAQRHGIRLGLEVDPRLGDFQADERKVKQILVNLLSNAVKFTPDGGRVDVIAKQDTTKIAIAVKDTGIGIAAEDHAAVFEEFKQVGRDYTRKAEGTGLGLALTKRFVELHGGEITLASAPGKGSTFTVTLPIRQ